MLADVVERIQQRLRAVGLSESAASKRAGLSADAIRNMRRAVEDRREQGASTLTLEKLAPVLQTTVSWLITGVGPVDGDRSYDERIRRIKLRRPDLASAAEGAIEGVLRSFEGTEETSTKSN